jgi:hypothetical protein
LIKYKLAMSYSINKRKWIIFTLNISF